MIYLHIGRNKAGSTTLQDAWRRQLPALRSSGIELGLLGWMRTGAGDVPEFATLLDVADHARGRPDESILVSNEILSGWPDAFVADAAKALQGLDVTIIAYIRDYRDWVFSSYAFDVRIGWNARDFDDYLTWLGDSVSYWPALERWGAAFGWDRMRVRSLDPQSLVGGDIVADGFAALGLDPALAGEGRGVRSNVSTHWMAVELTRAMIEQSNTTGWQGNAATDADFARRSLEACIAESGAGLPPARYLTAGQAYDLAERYNGDVGRIVAQTGTPIPFASIAASAERPFLPSLAHIPPDILSRFEQRMTAAGRALPRLA